MEYAANLLNPRSVLVPALALVIGAGGAIGIYAALDDTDSVLPTRVVVTEPPAQPSEGVAAKHESSTASAIANPGSGSSLAGKDEAASAAAIANPSSGSWLESKDEAKTASAVGSDQQSEGGIDPQTANRTDPHGPAAALP